MITKNDELQPTVIRPEVYNDPILDDFRNFLFLVWQHLNLPVPTPIQYDIAHFLQHGERRSIIEAFRGVGKSWVTSAFVIWLLLRNPQLKILVVSASKGRSDDFSTFTKQLINDMPMLAKLKAKHGQRDSNVAFDVGEALPDHSPSVKSVGITGQLAGTRADYIIPDDVEVPNNSLTQLMRDRLAEAVKEFDAILKPGGHIKYLGTPQTEMSIYNTLEERGYTIRVWPSRYPKAEQQMLMGKRLAPYITDKLEADPELVNSPHHNKYGKPTDADRFDELDLMEREASYGRSGFALQFMLDTTISDGDRYPLKLKDLIVMNTTVDLAPIKVAWGCSPDTVINNIPHVALAGDSLNRPIYVHEKFKEFSGSVMWIDPSGRGTDETSYCVVKMLNGFLYLRRSGGFLSGYEDETLIALAKIAKEENVNYIGVEDNFGDGMFTALFKPHLNRAHSCQIEGMRNSKMKEKRIIDTLEPIMNQHRLVVDETLFKKDLETPNEKYQLFYQLTRITAESGALGHDDRLDVLAMAVAYWVEQMDRDVEVIEDQFKEEELRKSLESFMSNAVGFSDSDSNWMS